ncbi:MULTISPECIES: hypothetical protein [Vibrio]|uniref:Uncharacterized protein n=1 Tax=Vibrio diazotrophicus TaxID=685 RepID=A0A329EG09_VIBDI|nr:MULTISPECIES: hypothetical protein [Vibrio]MCF7362240.1 hypothetical protein [Vibrio sp. A1-b2]RAS69499.1 hypothetical protein DET48_10173 [Vibrio diazotrophicus]
MELRNKAGQVTQLADNLTLKEVQDMGFTIDLCDEAYDPNEHWQVQQDKHNQRRDYPEE